MVSGRNSNAEGARICLAFYQKLPILAKMAKTDENLNLMIFKAKTTKEYSHITICGGISYLPSTITYVFTNCSLREILTLDTSPKSASLFHRSTSLDHPRPFQYSLLEIIFNRDLPLEEKLELIGLVSAAINFKLHRDDDTNLFRDDLIMRLACRNLKHNGIELGLEESYAMKGKLNGKAFLRSDDSLEVYSYF